MVRDSSLNLDPRSEENVSQQIDYGLATYGNPLFGGAAARHMDSFSGYIRSLSVLSVLLGKRHYDATATHVDEAMAIRPCSNPVQKSGRPIDYQDIAGMAPAPKGRISQADQPPWDPSLLRLEIRNGH